MSNDVKTDKIEIDEDKAIRLIKKLLIKESYNLKTKEKNDIQMATEIKKYIEEEVKCY